MLPKILTCHPRVTGNVIDLHFHASSSRTASQYSCTHSQYQMYRLCYCSRYCSITPCLEGEGDCGADSECQGSLVCGSNNCANNTSTHCCMKTLLKTESTLVTATTTLITTVTPTETPSSIAATSTTAPTTANNKFTTSITKTTNKCKKSAWAIYSITTTSVPKKQDQEQKIRIRSKQDQNQKLLTEFRSSW